MATCKDCLHDYVCYRHCELQNDEGCDCCNIKVCTYENCAEKCPSFTDKSRFVEPSCQLWDKVWVIDKILDRDNGGLKKVICEGEIIKVSYNAFSTPEEWLDYRWDSLMFGQCARHDRVDLCIGKTVFLTREEAEAAIKEKEKENEADRRR